MTLTATAAIARSVAHNEIVTIDTNGESLATRTALMRDLVAACEDNTQNGFVTEYWGTTDDGNEWRVHVHHDTTGNY